MGTFRGLAKVGDSPKKVRNRMSKLVHKRVAVKDQNTSGRRGGTKGGLVSYSGIGKLK
tara:strand:+ start:61 stop:234 length:174 start_codon:yes stop_codon:yes gene_type:complete